jgi:phosphoribosyl-AMP cyclohydrolase
VRHVRINRSSANAAEKIRDVGDNVPPRTIAGPSLNMRCIARNARTTSPKTATSDGDWRSAASAAHSFLHFFICRIAWNPYSSVRMSFYDKLKFNSDGLIPAIIQEQSTGRVLMMAWMNRASLEKTIATGKTHFWSRSRQTFWIKGETSGHTQTVKDISFDCDGDTLLIQVDQIGTACHEGYKSCFFRSVEDGGKQFRVTEPQLVTPKAIYEKK